MTIEQFQTNENIKKSKKINYIEGIRGMAAFMVVIHHYLLAFYPALTSGNTNITHTASIELLYYKSPFIFLTNGQLFVHIFFILSGYVLSKKFFIEKNIDYLVSASIRRFPRLFIPVAFALVIAFSLLKMSLYFDLQASSITKSAWLSSLHANTSVINFLKCFFYKVMFFSDFSYITVLWSISVELYGSFLVFSTLALTRNIKNFIVVLVLLFVLFFLGNSFEYCSFILGITLNYTSGIEIKKLLHKRVIIILFFLTGLFLGGFPHIHYLTTPSIKGTFYNFLNYTFLINKSAFINCVGAYLLILAVQQSLKLQYIFSSKSFTFLGNISFSMYLLHAIILQSISSFIFLKLNLVSDYNISFLLTFIISLNLTFIGSYLMTIYVDKQSLTISKYIYKRFFYNAT